MIQETKPRLAKYGFAIEMSEDILGEGSTLAAMNEILKGFPESKDGGAWFRQFRNSMGNWVLTIYINDKALYDAIKLVVEPK